MSKFLQALGGGDFFDKRRQLLGPIYRCHVFGRPTIRVSNGELMRQVLAKEHNAVDTSYPKTVQVNIAT